MTARLNKDRLEESSPGKLLAGDDRLTRAIREWLRTECDHDIVRRTFRRYFAVTNGVLGLGTIRGRFSWLQNDRLLCF